MICSPLDATHTDGGWGVGYVLRVFENRVLRKIFVSKTGR